MWPLIAYVKAVSDVRKESIYVLPVWVMVQVSRKKERSYGSGGWVTGGGARGRPSVSVGHHSKCTCGGRGSGCHENNDPYH